VTPEIAGPVFTGAIATFYGLLADELVGHGHEATVAHALGEHSEPGEEWVNDCAKRGVGVVEIQDVAPLVQSSHPRRRSYAAYRWLRKHEDEFDVVHFPEWQGLGYYSLQAKRQGIAFQELRFVVVCHGSTMFHAASRLQPIDTPDYLEQDFMERESIRLADVVVSPTWFHLVRMQAENWPLPEPTHVHPYPSPPEHSAKLRPGVDIGEGGKPWVALHEAAHGRRPTPARMPRTGARNRARKGKHPAPPVSVCLTHFNRPNLLRQALASLEAQDYPNFEVVLVDDASTEPEALATLDTLQPEFDRRGWQIVRHARNLWLGAACNTAAAHARGEFLLLMTDDNYAKPSEISTFVAVTQRTGADIVVCPCDVFSHDDEPAAEEVPQNRWIPLGPALLAGLLRNCFGDLNGLVRRSAYEAIGGYAEDRGFGYPDWEFYARAAFAGLRFEVVPEPLYWYRSRSSTMVHTSDRRANLERVLRTYLENTGPELHELFRAAQQAFTSTDGQSPRGDLPTVLGRLIRTLGVSGRALPNVQAAVENPPREPDAGFDR
jgi:glycosyltransferase involved in cell wall biosynthesis